MATAAAQDGAAEDSEGAARTRTRGTRDLPSEVARAEVGLLGGAGATGGAPVLKKSASSQVRLGNGGRARAAARPWAWCGPSARLERVCVWIRQRERARVTRGAAWTGGSSEHTLGRWHLIASFPPYADPIVDTRGR